MAAKRYSILGGVEASLWSKARTPTSVLQAARRPVVASPARLCAGRGVIRADASSDCAVRLPAHSRARDKGASAVRGQAADYANADFDKP